MSGATYIAGTDQFVEFEILCSTIGYVLDPDDWNVEAILVPIGGTYAEDADWQAVSLIVSDLKLYGQVLLSELLSPLVVGDYHIICQATATDAELENPLFIVNGLVHIRDPFGIIVEEATP
jgi:hypothetical protein